MYCFQHLVFDLAFFCLSILKFCEADPLLVQVTTNVTLGFVKDAKAHIDVQGFNVYHKNRLIKVSFII